LAKNLFSHVHQPTHTTHTHTNTHTHTHTHTLTAWHRHPPQAPHTPPTRSHDEYEDDEPASHADATHQVSCIIYQVYTTTDLRPKPWTWRGSLQPALRSLAQSTSAAASVRAGVPRAKGQGRGRGSRGQDDQGVQRDGREDVKGKGIDTHSRRLVSATSSITRQPRAFPPRTAPPSPGPPGTGCAEHCERPPSLSERP